MSKTIQVSKGLSVPYCFTTEALESFCEDIDTPLSDIYIHLTSSKGQRKVVENLFYHIVSAGYEKLGKPMPYTKDDVIKWIKGKNGVLNYPLFNSVTLIAIKTLFENSYEDEEEEVEAEKN